MFLYRNNLPASEDPDQINEASLCERGDGARMEMASIPKLKDKLDLTNIKSGDEVDEQKR